MRRRYGRFLALLVAAAFATIFSTPAAADKCSDLASLALPEVTSITATPVAANTFTRPPLFPGFRPGPLVPVAFCRVQITVEPQIKVEVWPPTPESWNHRFQAVGGGGYAGTISYPALARAVTGDKVPILMGSTQDVAAYEKFCAPANPESVNLASHVR